MARKAEACYDLRPVMKNWVLLLSFWGMGCPAPENVSTSDGGPPPVRVTPDDAGTPAPSPLGVYLWGSEPSFPKVAASEFRPFGAQKAYDLGLRVLRLPLEGTKEKPLAEVARQEDFQRVFQMPFHTLLLTVYTGSVRNGWVDGLSAAESRAEYEELRSLAEYLLDTYPQKRFVLLNWEGDHVFETFENGALSKERVAKEAPQWQGQRDWLQVRSLAVRDANASRGKTNDEFRVKYGLEFNMVFDLTAVDLTPQTKCLPEYGPRGCVISSIAPFVQADVYSFSAYQVTHTALEKPELLKKALDFAWEQLKTTKPDLGKDALMVGEYGFPRDVPGISECTVAQKDFAALKGLLDWGVSFAIKWNIFDAPTTSTTVSQGLWSQFGYFRADESLTLSARALQAFLEKKTFDFDALPCGTLQTFERADDATLPVVPGSRVQLKGSGFSDQGNQVFLYGKSQNFVFDASRLPAMSCPELPQEERQKQCFQETPTRLQLGLPTDLEPGPAFIKVLSAEGVETALLPFTVQEN